MKKTNIPKISVVMPVYNSSFFLDEAIKSILNQTFKDFEFIIIDDASRDNSLEIIKKYKTLDSRIILIENKSNQGISYNRNLGIQLAKAKIIAVVDSDDISYPERFQLQYKFLEKNTHISIVGTFADIIDPNGIKIDTLEFPFKPQTIKETFFYHYPFLQPTTMYRKKDILEVGGYRKEYSLVDEIDLYIRLFLSGKNGANIPKYLISYRKHDGSTEKYYKQKRNILFKLRKELLGKYKKNTLLGYWMYTYFSYMIDTIFSTKQKGLLIMFAKRTFFKKK